MIPVILRHIYWQGALGKLQALPTDAKPVYDRYWHNLDEALFNVVEGIRAAILKLEQNSTLSTSISESAAKQSSSNKRKPSPKIKNYSNVLFVENPKMLYND